MTLKRRPVALRAPRFLGRDRQRLFLFSCLWLTAVALHQVRLIPNLGLHYDEALFVNAATKGFRNTDETLFVTSRMFGLPILLMDYIGALKAWLFAPIFQIFGVSIWSIRLPAVLIGLICIVLTPRILHRSVASRTGLLIIVLTSLDPLFLLLIRADVGPSALSSLLRVLGLIISVRLLSENPHKAAGALVSLSLVITLGVFNKLDFVIFSVPLVIAILLNQPKNILAFSRSRRLETCFAFVILIAGHFLAFIFMYLPSRVGSPRVEPIDLQRLQRRVRLAVDSLSGQYMSSFIGGPDNSFSYPLLPLAAALGILCSIVINFRFWLARRQRSEDPVRSHLLSKGIADSHLLRFFLTLLIGMLLAQILVSGVAWPWHVIHLWPVAHLALVCGLRISISSVFGWRSVTTVTLATCLVVVLGAGVLVGQRFDALQVNSNSRSTFWTSEPTRAGHAIQRLSQEIDGSILVVAVEWGLGTQLLASTVNSPNVVVRDFWPLFLDGQPETIRDAIENGKSSPGDLVIFVRHRPASVVMVPSSLSISEEIATECGRHEELFAGAHLDIVLTTC